MWINSVDPMNFQGDNQISNKLEYSVKLKKSAGADHFVFICGEYRIRTDHLFTASEAL